jgi:ATP-dependent DNA helicase PIF1
MIPFNKTTYLIHTQIPVNDNNAMLVSELSSTSSRADLLRSASLFIIDEAPAGNKAIYSCIDQCLRLITRVDAPFGNKIIILVGDFRQCGPVIRGGSRTQIVDASLRKSNLWPLFRIESLSIPIRNAQDLEFASFVDGIGDGDGPEIAIPFVSSTTDKNRLIDFVWPEEILTQPEQCLGRCILAPTN